MKKGDCCNTQPLLKRFKWKSKLVFEFCVPSIGMTAAIEWTGKISIQMQMHRAHERRAAKVMMKWNNRDSKLQYICTIFNCHQWYLRLFTGWMFQLNILYIHILSSSSLFYSDFGTFVRLQIIFSWLFLQQNYIRVDIVISEIVYE